QHTERPAVPRGAARAKAAASAVHSDKLGLDPARLRLLVLSAIMALVLLVFAYIFWQAVYGPGAGSKLPMVPMPPPNATGATPALVVVAQPAGAGATDAGTAEQLGHMADIQHYNMQEAQRREEQRQFELSRASARLPAPPPAPETVAPAAPPADAGIQVRHTRPAPQLDPALQAGYAAVNNGDWPAAQQQYDSVLARDANNRDALLGSAAVAERQKRPDQATAAYLRLLELDPGDADAMAGLIGLNQGDQEQSEQRLQNLLKQHPESGPLHFALGNLYARQGRWPDAQQSYFRAYSAAPGDADYAYNLAVGLDRLNQPKLALTYYQRALALAQDRAANFDRNALRKRMHDLAPAAAR
ncbi:tetratricopeptide repeat protein, partial [Rugamonas sp.]|uniref:tetratricopeptide repeat protein n=1 Tax=Rugamonas sp. TaxID=1926287 RepID=UPI0025F3F332